MNYRSFLFIPPLIIWVRGPALAAGPLGDWDLASQISLTSDYVARGISQSDRAPALQGGVVALAPQGWYLGAWGSQVDFNDGGAASMELELYGGFRTGWENGLGLDLGVIHYEYPGARSTLKYDFQEFSLEGSHTGPLGTLAVKYSHAPRYSGATDGQNSSYLEGSLARPLPGGLTGTLHVGRFWGEILDNDAGRPAHYHDYRISLSRELEGVMLELSWWGTDRRAETLYGQGAGERLVVTVGHRF